MRKYAFLWFCILSSQHHAIILTILKQNRCFSRCCIPFDDFPCIEPRGRVVYFHQHSYINISLVFRSNRSRNLSKSLLLNLRWYIDHGVKVSWVRCLLRRLLIRISRICGIKFHIIRISSSCGIKFHIISKSSSSKKTR